MGMDNSFVAHRASGRHRRDRCSYLGHAFCHGQSDYQGKGDSHECYFPVSVSGVLFLFSCLCTGRIVRGILFVGNIPAQTSIARLATPKSVL